MKLKNLIYSLLGIAISCMVSSCDPSWAVSPKFNGSLVIFNGLEYPVSIKGNFDIRNGCLYPDGEREQIIQPLDTVHLVSNLPLGYLHADSFEDIWKNSSTKPIYYHLYKLNPETYEEEEMIKNWEQGSYFFEEDSWKWVVIEYATKKNPIALYEFTFNLW